MKTCRKCGKQFGIKKVIDGKSRNLKNRTLCLDCLPFKSSTFASDKPDGYERTKFRDYYARFKNVHGIDPIARRRIDRKNTIISLLGGKCQLCGYNTTPRNLAFHHISEKLKDTSSRLFQYSWETILSEVVKCILVCHNCHGEIHDGLINDSSISTINENNRLILDSWKAV